MSSQNGTHHTHVFGIRHHGPGSARSLAHALQNLRPDIILVEGPPDAAEVLPLLNEPDMQPPVALLVYMPDQPKRAVYFPFAVYSPEWQAISYGLKHALPVRFIDLPQAYQMASEIAREQALAAQNNPDISNPSGVSAELEPQLDPLPAPTRLLKNPRPDPLGWLAQVAGYDDGERWWEQMVEHRQNDTDLFVGILEMMQEVRDATEALEQADALLISSELDQTNLREQQREAWMRQTIRAAQNEGFERIAVVCGAWHAPVLAKMPCDAPQDAAILKNLAKVKVTATWVPWTYGRFAYSSGYGAGVMSPGWYHHLWNTPDKVVVRWLIRVARLLRSEDLDASAASVIETVRLAETLAALRDKPLPGLEELNEATQTVLCNGNPAPLRLIYDKLIVGERMGEVPDKTPMMPLQQNLVREQKRLRLPPSPSQTLLDLDLRKPNDLERSILLHRLALLQINWGVTERVSGKTGTFHENWRLQWQPEFAIKLIEAAVWGNTIHDATTTLIQDTANRATELPTLTELLNHTLLAALPDAVSYLMLRLQSLAALANDITHLMQALPQLAQVFRYGNVRQTATTMVGQIVDGLVARICIGLPPACSSLNDEAAAKMYIQLNEVNATIDLLQNPAHTQDWQKVLQYLANQPNLHGLIAGRCCRLLLETDVLTSEEAARRLGLALSTATEPSYAAVWLEGFLKGSGLVLLHYTALWQVLDAWVTNLPGDVFQVILPLLRRTFATFSAPERRQMGEQVKRDFQRPNVTTMPLSQIDFDVQRAEAVLPLVRQLLGLDKAL